MAYKTALARHSGEVLRREFFIFFAVARSTRQLGPLVTCILHLSFVSYYS